MPLRRRAGGRPRVVLVRKFRNQVTYQCPLLSGPIQGRRSLCSNSVIFDLTGGVEYHAGLFLHVETSISNAETHARQMTATVEMIKRLMLG